MKWAWIAVLLAGAASPAALAAEYTSTAIVAILPGNPFRSRLFSLRRVVLTQEFFDGLVAGYFVSEPQTKLSIEWRPDADLVVRFLADDPETAVGVTNDIMRAFVEEMDRRRAQDPRYGGGRRVTTARPIQGAPRGAEGVLRIEGLSWDEADQKESRRQMSDLPNRILDAANLRDAASLAGLRSREDIGRITQEVRSSVSFHPSGDSAMRVTMVTSDIRRVALLGLLLSNAEKREIALSDRVPELDLDFVPQRMRREWYIFNCCQVTVKE